MSIVSSSSLSVKKARAGLVSGGLASSLIAAAADAIPHISSSARVSGLIVGGLGVASTALGWAYTHVQEMITEANKLIKLAPTLDQIELRKELSGVSDYATSEIGKVKNDISDLKKNVGGVTDQQVAASVERYLASKFTPSSVSGG